MSDLIQNTNTKVVQWVFTDGVEKDPRLWIKCSNEAIASLTKPNVSKDWLTKNG